MPTLSSHLLIASPRMDDPNFAQSVVLIVQHDEEGAFGLVLNRPSDTGVKTLWQQVGEGQCASEGQVHIGGPCGGPLMALHTAENAGQRQVLPGLWFTSDADDLRWLVEHDPPRTRYFVGYAGWAPGQLETELQQSAWHLLPATMDMTTQAPSGVWTQLIGRIMGVPAWPRVIPPDPSVN
jgi:putative transcriptional regulator